VGQSDQRDQKKGKCKDFISRFRGSFLPWDLPLALDYILKQFSTFSHKKENLIAA